ncbi:hypothetical protein UFOVP707_61 [uncultured Caudovirales phage]|uniref:Uncharacterized protein n=1 Tax=uncultured Caudovirales phage TaxID=2100421 RepID=A0A6J5NKG0_9CAUD|nr:hypothetical protein UFOVP707_61 [uncultured Caudovirales phage]
MNIPIITLQVEGMKHTVRTALMREAAALDKGVQDALDKLCTEERIAAIVEEEARRQIEAALKEEVQSFFRWSAAGRAAVREAVHEHLERMYPPRDAG